MSCQCVYVYEMNDMKCEWTLNISDSVLYSIQAFTEYTFYIKYVDIVDNWTSENPIENV